MAIHPVKLPLSAKQLFRVVGLQARLLKALAAPTLNWRVVDTSWVQGVWKDQDAAWVHKFCLGGQEKRIQAIARAPAAVRSALLKEFLRQNRTATLHGGGGAFPDLLALLGGNQTLLDDVTEFFVCCYKRLGTDGDRWKGYDFGKRGVLSRLSYQQDFCSTLPTSVLCPYCDGEIQSPELDHYYHKTCFPLIACSPWNLIPVCSSCNEVIDGKGARPALDMGPPTSCANWLHPFFRAASTASEMRLGGNRAAPVLELWSSDPAEDVRLKNHTKLIPSLARRWQRVASARFDQMVRDVQRKRSRDPSATVDSLISIELEDLLEARGKEASTLAKAAVCRAVLVKRPGFIEEFSDSNPPALA